MAKKAGSTPSRKPAGKGLGNEVTGTSPLGEQEMEMKVKNE